MKAKGSYYFLLWCASTLGVLTFIFCNSLRPAAASSEQSEAVFGVLQMLLFFLPFLTHAMVRALAHMVEFALLGAHFALLPFLFPQKALPFRIYLLFLGMLVPFIDEGIQAFVAGRAATFSDVLVDAIGYLLGAACMLLIALLWRKKRRKGERHAKKAL